MQYPVDDDLLDLDDLELDEFYKVIGPMYDNYYRWLLDNAVVQYLGDHTVKVIMNNPALIESSNGMIYSAYMPGKTVKINNLKVLKFKKL